MSYWPFTMRRDTKKDERITELEAQVARLTDQNTKIAEANQETERILADQDVFIAALKADKMRLEQEATEQERQHQQEEQGSFMGKLEVVAEAVNGARIH